MKKSKHQKCIQLEGEILTEVNIDLKYVIIENCQLDNGRVIHYLRFHKIPVTKNVLLMTHGYLNSNIGYFRMYGNLMEHFHIVSFDLPGQGLSSSEMKTPDSIDNWIAYFTETIKLFVDKLELKKFHIMGHSLGAYILTQFTNRYPEMVQKMFLLSPGGVNKDNPEFIKNGKEYFKNQGVGTNFVVKKVVKKMFEEKKSPMDFWGLGIFRKFIATKVFSGDRLRLYGNERKLFISLFKEIYNSEPSSEKCVGYIFNNGPMSDRPLMPIFEKLHKQKQIHIFFGALDWMDFELTTTKVVEKNLNISIQHIDDAGHQLIYQNPNGTFMGVIEKFLENPEKEEKREDKK
jgi:cardiolipin-specific phospholipase